MQFPYGAVYFRKSNPPREDWERDYRTAAEDGLNIFRHWVMWSAIEIAPGVYDWEEYDRQLDLAAENGIKTIIAEMLTIPEWLAASEPDLLYQKMDGMRCRSHIGVSSATGGFNAGPCLDNPKGKEYAERFLRALAERYKDHPALLGYDVWNECNYPEDICACPHTMRAWHAWLERKYGDIQTLGRAWHRYSYTSYDQVAPPPELSLYPESLDWIAFRRENFYSHMQWRIERG